MTAALFQVTMVTLTSMRLIGAALTPRSETENLSGIFDVGWLGERLPPTICSLATLFNNGILPVLRLARVDCSLRRFPVTSQRPRLRGDAQREAPSSRAPPPRPAPGGHGHPPPRADDNARFSSSRPAQAARLCCRVWDLQV